jgi:gliding motility-associatede transport system auxiliary component
MDTQISRRAISIATLVLLAIFFVAVNLFSNISFRTSRIDLTQSSLFTLSDGTRNLLLELEEPVTLRFFFSESLATDFPRIRTYAGRVRDVLEEMRSYSNGNLVLEVIDPEPFSEQEDRAMSLGLKGAPTTEGEVIYFGLAGTNLVDGIEAIPFFTDEREEYLEYDIARLVQNLTRPEKPILGIVTNLPLDTGAGGLMAAMRGESQSFMLYNELLDRFTLEFLEQDFDRVPNSVSVLMVAHPKPLDEQTLYAIDQFMLRGGRALVFLDPHSEVSLTSGANGQPVQGYTEASSLDRLMKSWGVDLDPTLVIGDRGNAQRVQAGFDARRQMSDYIVWMALGADDMNREDVVTANIDRLNLGTVGNLVPRADATTSFTPVMSSSDDAMLLDLEFVKTGPTPDALLRQFEATGERYVVAARVVGPLVSSFPDGAPEAPDREGGLPVSIEGPGPHLERSTEDANIIIVADSEIFDDRFWVQTQSYLGERIARPIADNATFILNAVDNLMGSNDLISLRAREKSDRPFLVVDELRREAETNYLAQEEALQAKIAETESRLASLQTRAPEGADPSEFLSESEAAEIRQFRAELGQSRAALRDVQRNLRRGIEDLGSRVRFINVALMPLLIGALALVLAFFRSKRRKARVGMGRQ